MNTMNRLAAVALITGLTLAVGTDALAAAPTDGAEALRYAANGIEQRLLALQNNAGIMKIGLTLFGFFALANSIYYLIKGYATGSGLNGVMADFIGLAVLCGVVHLFLDRNIGQAIVDSVNTLAEILTGERPTMASLMTLSASTMFDALEKMFDIGLTNINAGAWYEWAALLPSFILKIVALLVTAFLMVLSLCVYFAVLVTSQVAVSVALILAPFFVPFLLFQPASFMFDGWLRFTIGAALMKVIGLLMLAVTKVIMEQLEHTSAMAVAAKSANQMNHMEALSVDMVLYATMVLLSGLSAYMMAQVPSIATGLLSGGAGGAGFSGWSQIASKSMATRGVLGGMNAGQANTRAAMGGGGGGGQGQLTHPLSRVEAATPNVLKPAVSAAGRAIGSIGGAAKARAHFRQGSRSDGRTVAFSTKSMSATAERAYRSAFEARNQKMHAKGGGHVSVQAPKPLMDQPQPPKP